MNNSPLFHSLLQIFFYAPGMCSKLCNFLITCSLFVTATVFPVFGQVERSITRSEEVEIKFEAKNLLATLEEEYEFLLTSNSSQRRIRIDGLLDRKSSARMFADQNVIIENDFFDADVANLPAGERDKQVREYFEDMARKFGLNDNQQEPNRDKHVKINFIRSSKVQARSAKQPMYIKVVFHIAYDGLARDTQYPFKSAFRLAEMELEREGKSLHLYITSIRFADESAVIDDESQVVTVLEDAAGGEVKFSDAIKSEYIRNVSRLPLLKTFMVNDLWGLLIDEDGNRRILAQPQFCEINDFQEEKLTAVCLDGKWGYMDKEGRLVIPCQYERAEPFKKDKATVWFGTKILTIGTDGREVK